MGAICAALILASPTRAVDPGSTSNASAASAIWLLGDWSDARTRLRNAGVDFQLGHVGEVADNATGGLHREVAYADQWAAGVTNLAGLGPVAVQGGEVADESHYTFRPRNGLEVRPNIQIPAGRAKTGTRWCSA